MAIKINFDLVGNPEPPTIILANRNGNKLGQLKVNEDSIELIDKFNDASEVSFTINKYIDNEITPLWDKVVDFKLVYFKEWDMWFEIKLDLDESTETVKTVYCTQLGQAELSQIMLYNIEINTEKDIERDDYKISILYDKNDPKSSILSRLLRDKAPHYSIAHVDSTIANIQRSFSFDGTSIHDAFQEIAEEIGCLFVYNSNSSEDGKIQRTISVYDLQQNCNDCEHRGEFTDKCPKCGSTNIKHGYGEDTLIFVTSDELASSGIQLTTDTDSVKNCFKLETGDDLMTATVRNCNPNGTDYIWYFSDNIKEDMSDELVEKIESYNEIYKQYYNEYVSNVDADLLNDYNALVDKYSVYNKDLQKITTPITGYSALMNAYYNVIDLSLYLESGLMPSIEMSETSAEEQAGLLTSTSLSPIAVADITVASLSTVNSAALAMAKTVVKPTYKVQVNTSEIYDSGNKRFWKGNFVVTNYSDEEDTAISNVISVEVNDDLETFTKQKIDRILNKENTDDFSISGLFEKEHDDFCAELKKYALNPLVSFRDAGQACIDILIEQGICNGDTWGDTDEGAESNLYEKLYTPYYNKLMAIESEIKVREDEIAIVSGVYDLDGNLISKGLQTNIEECKFQIQTALNFENYLGNELWLEFCAYRREDKYANDNYISDGLNNAELFKRALEFFEVAENEIYKASELQHSISTTLNNLLAIPKFKPLVKSFDVGNWIRVQVDGRIYKLRLLEYDIDFGDFNNISVEFSDVTKIKNGITDVESILSQASSMATSYSSVQRQASKGNEAQDTVEQWFSNGLNSALVQIQSNDNEDITFTKNGLLCRSYDDITETYSPEQLKLTHNIMAYTDDDWKTVRQAIGKHEYIVYDKSKNDFVNKIGYGINADFMTAGVVSGSQIIGGDIYSDNYSKSSATGSYLNLRDGTFSFGGGSLRYEGGNLLISSPDVITKNEVTEINEKYLKTTTVYAENLQVKAANIQDQLTASQINTKGLIAENISATTITGKDITGGSLLIGNKSSTYAEITSGGVLNCSGANITGTINATGGTIGGCNIVDGVLQIKNANIVEKLTASQINTTGLIAENISGTTLSGKTISGGSISIGDAFSVSSEGVLNCSSANVSGVLTAGVGSSLGGFKVDGNSLYKGSWGSSSPDVFMCTGSSGTYTLGGHTGSGWVFGAGSKFGVTSTGSLYCSALNSSGGTIGCWNINSGGLWAGSSDGSVAGVSLGKTTLFTSTGSGWRQVYWYQIHNCVYDWVSNSSSDINVKNNISNIDSYDALFDNLKPCRYKYNYGTSDRYHTGFIAQEVVEAIECAGLTTQDFAGVVHLEEPNENGSEWILRKDEFVALNTWQIQKLKLRVAELESKLNDLKLII